jgi:sigma-B regulation protein RsbU (phosphoserine phosphatase)
MGPFSYIEVVRMPKDKGLPVRVEGIQAKGLAGALAALMDLTSDAVLAFDARLRVVAANQEASRLLGAAPDALLGADMRDLFEPERGMRDPDDPAVPFELEGSSVCRACSFAGKPSVPVAMRCARTGASDGLHVLCVRPVDPNVAFAHERDRLVGELYEANHRLAGTLRIVLDTLDTQEIGTLFARVARELRDVMEADDVLVYVAEEGGYRLRGHAGTPSASQTSVSLPYDSSLVRIATSHEGSVRLKAAGPTRESLRSGSRGGRELVDEATREVYRVEARLLPPWATMIVVPVWFGERVIALLLLGWPVPHPTRTEDARLLDAVTQYLSAQIMGAIDSLRAQRAAELDRDAQGLHDRLVALGGYDEGYLDEACASVARSLSAQVCGIGRNDRQNVSVVRLPLHGVVDFPFPEAKLAPAAADAKRATIIPLRPGTELTTWLAEQGEPACGAYVDTGELPDGHHAALVLRGEEAGPLSGVELGFLRRVSEDVLQLSAGAVRRDGDHRISQALMTGMRNELQDVEGIEAHGVYSSATADAFVGGDFYDLIRLPERRACVILGDVSGKGVEAASVSAAVRTALGAYAWVGLSPAQMVRNLNDFLLGFSRLETFATLFVGIASLAEGRLSYCSAGHPPALLVRDRSEARMLDVQSGIVGAFSDMDYRDGFVDLQEGDTLFLYTDGATEARDPEGAFFGEERLRDAVLRHAAAGEAAGIASGVLADLDAFTRNRLEDDVALVDITFQRLGGA